MMACICELRTSGQVVDNSKLVNITLAIYLPSRTHIHEYSKKVLQGASFQIFHASDETDFLNSDSQNKLR